MWLLGTVHSFLQSLVLLSTSLATADQMLSKWTVDSSHGSATMEEMCWEFESTNEVHGGFQQHLLLFEKLTVPPAIPGVTVGQRQSVLLRCCILCVVSFATP